MRKGVSGAKRQRLLLCCSHTAAQTSRVMNDAAHNLNVDERNQYYSITKLENDNTVLFIKRVDELEKRVGKLEKGQYKMEEQINRQQVFWPLKGKPYQCEKPESGSLERV